VDNLVSPSRNLEIEPLVFRQLLLNIHTSLDPLFLDLNDSIHSVQNALLPWCQSGKSQNLEGGGGIDGRFGLTCARRFGQSVLQFRADRGEIRERLGVIEEFAGERKSVLSLDPRGGNECDGDVPNVGVAEGFGGKGHVGVDEVVRAHCRADRGRLAGFDDLFLRERSDEQRRADCGRNCDSATPERARSFFFLQGVDVRVVMLSSGCSLAYAHRVFSAIAFEAAYTAIGSDKVTATSSVISNQSMAICEIRSFKVPEQLDGPF